MSSGAVLGIDPSLTGFAYALSLPGVSDHLVERLSSKPTGKDVHSRMARINTITQPVTSLVLQHKPTLTLVEGYSMGSVHGQLSTYELGAILRWRTERHTRLLEVAPGTLKKWATGRGTAPKSDVVSMLTMRYDRRFPTDDEADAFALMMIGRQLLGQDMPATKAQREVIAKLGKGLEAAA